MPTDRWTISNTTSVNNTRISGNSAFLEITASTSQFQEFEHLGIRHISNASEVNFRAHPKLGVYGAYRFSRRRIQTRESFHFPDFDFEVDLSSRKATSTRASAGFAGVPGESCGYRSTRSSARRTCRLPPRSERKFHSETVRVQWRRNGFLLGGNFKSRENDNSATLITHSSVGGTTASTARG